MSKAKSQSKSNSPTTAKTKLTFGFKMTPEEITLGLSSVQRRSKTINLNLHQMCCSVLATWADEKNGNAKAATQKATEIVLGSGYHSQAIANWFTHFAEFTWDPEEKSFVYSPSRTKCTVEQFQEAKAVPFSEFSPPKDVKPMDILAKVSQLINQAESRLKAPAEKRSSEDLVSLEEVNVLKTALSTLEASRKAA